MEGERGPELSEHRTLQAGPGSRVPFSNGVQGSEERQELEEPRGCWVGVPGEQGVWLVLGREGGKQGCEGGWGEGGCTGS